jgi:hypothetical protein
LRYLNATILPKAVQSYEKSRAMQKKSLFFFSLPSASNFALDERKVTKSREKYKTNAFVFISETKYL